MLDLSGLKPPAPLPARPVALQRSIVWEDDGNGTLIPKPVNVPIIDAKAANALVSVAMSMPYTGRVKKTRIVEKDEHGGSVTVDHEEQLPVEPEFEGMSQLEVAMIRLARLAASGDDKALEQMLDRVLGKPITKGMNLSSELPYEKFLEAIAKKEGLAP